MEKMQRGFSFIEILVAIVILAVSILGIMAVLPSGYKEITSAGRMSTLNHLAQLKIDQLKATPYTASDLIAGLHPTPTPPWRPTYTDANGSPAYTEYSVTWYVQDDIPKSGMKTVQVEAGFMLWDHGSPPAQINSSDTQDQRIVRLITYLTQ
jgi:prepilin-type N-terminal cleavage/methylation domain-containing protein